VLTYSNSAEESAILCSNRDINYSQNDS